MPIIFIYKEAAVVFPMSKDLYLILKMKQTAGGIVLLAKSMLRIKI